MSETERRGPTLDAAFAGTFYPASAAALAAEVEACLCEPATRPSGRLRGLVVPHAGYRYSGPTAGRGYALARECEGIRRVVVLAPSHRVAFSGVSPADVAAIRTPAGDAPADREACRRILAAGGLFRVRTDACTEHALEVQIPFLQSVLPEARVVPLVCGALRDDEFGPCARVLATLAGDDTLWIASSDFTHFGARFGYVPFAKDILRRIEELDGGAIRAILDIAPGSFRDYVAKTGATICGRTPIALLLETLKQAYPGIHGTLLDYTTSGRMTGDYSHSVSYAAIAFADGPAGDVTPTEPFRLRPETCAVLLKLARDTIAAEFDDREPDCAPALEDDDALRPGACFVSLHRNGALRGCIGHLEASEPLYENVMRNARNAAFRDSRFRPLPQEDLASTEIEISVLSPMRPVASWREIEIGRHGIVLEKGGRRAVFLPHVAPRQGWDLETTLSRLAGKAGLRHDDWRRNASYRVFEAFVFSESS